MNKNFVAFIEKIGYVNKQGKHIRGTAALLHVLHSPVKHVSLKMIRAGKICVQNLLAQ